MGGFSLLETLAALAISAMVAAAALSGLNSLAANSHLNAARSTVVQALIDARLQAASRAETVELAIGSRSLGPARAGGGAVLSAEVRLPAGTYVARAPARGRVRFFATGLADNATVVVAASGSAGEASVVVNQRGMIR